MDTPPRKEWYFAQFLESERLRTLDLPQDGYFLTPAESIEAAMNGGTTADVRRACADFLSAISEFYKVPTCGVRVLAARPLRVREDWATELFAQETMLIRVWMRTAVRKQVTSFGTFLSTLCHEFCHHLDFQHFGFRDSWHTRGFYERARRAVPPCTGNTAKATVLDTSSGWTLAN